MYAVLSIIFGLAALSTLGWGWQMLHAATQPMGGLAILAAASPLGSSVIVCAVCAAGMGVIERLELVQREAAELRRIGLGILAGVPPRATASPQPASQPPRIEPRAILKQRL